MPRLAAILATPRALCAVCGPAPLVADVPALLRGLGIDEARILVQEW